MGETQIGILDCISQYLYNSSEGKETELYGYSLHVEVTGTREGRQVRHVLYHTHPTSDGSIAGWEKLRAYTRNVGIPMAIATELIARGAVNKRGVITPEEAFDPAVIFAELAKRQIVIHEEITELVAQQ